MIIKTILYLIIASIIILFAINARETGMSKEQLLKEMQEIEIETMNMTQTIPYTSLYQNEITTERMIHNLINPIIYTLVVGVNTIIPILVHITYGNQEVILLRVSIVITILVIVTTFMWIITKLIILHFFLKEKKKTKTKWHE